ncbi:hypothetical protein Pmar_PMAR006102, partial [Perkinsus marinus ATCC 50983]
MPATSLISQQWRRAFATKRSSKARQRVFDMKVSKNAPTKARCAYRAIEEEFRALRRDRKLKNETRPFGRGLLS